METDLQRTQLAILNEKLKSEQNADGFWTGMLSSSALSTATSIVALKINGNPDDESRILSGCSWLNSNINADGGFGDTPESESNVSTSLLCYAAVYYCQSDDQVRKSILNRIEKYLETKGIRLNSQDITSSVLKFYGNDYTFSVPILSMLAICGVLSEEAFKYIPRLPFELSLLPSSYYRFFKLQVVSYAIPALIGVGIFIHTRRRSEFSLGNIYRNRSIAPAIRKLRSIMPDSGGFLEAIPLTAFVSMCLIASDNKYNEVVTKGMSFLRNQQRADGSWPIDTDLSNWVTTLSIKALGSQIKSFLSSDSIGKLRTHLLSTQYKDKHPFNGARPGGWGWTNFSGSVPDADDTSGAILALLDMYEGSADERTAIINGCIWLEQLQNTDGGFPTFCRGWGRLPFDSSSDDLTGHSLLALLAAMDRLEKDIPFPLRRKLNRSVFKAIEYLKKHQADDGHWVPLWFGNQITGDKKNPVYGTARVSSYLRDCLNSRSLSPELKSKMTEMIYSAQHYLLSQQNPDGSWGGAKDIHGTIEETSLAISALVEFNIDSCLKGFEWLREKNYDNELNSAPIGLYFAMLWYDEKMYPLVLYIEALRRFLNINPVDLK
jgi:prenyltransferase beta subunit